MGQSNAAGALHNLAVNDEEAQVCVCVCVCVRACVRVCVRACVLPCCNGPAHEWPMIFWVKELCCDACA